MTLIEIFNSYDDNKGKDKHHLNNFSRDDQLKYAFFK